MSKALVAIDEVLDTELPERDDPAFVRVLSAKKDAAVSIVNAGLKADENRFRKRNTDVLEKLMDALRKETSITVLEA